jgi:hypothetical protein
MQVDEAIDDAGLSVLFASVRCIYISVQLKSLNTHV